MNDILKKISNWALYNRPDVGSADDWEEWESEYKRSAPIRHAVFRDFPRLFCWPLRHKYDRMLDYVRYRITRPHVLETGLPPEYYEKDTLMLHVTFNLLKDFVEIEKASMYRFCHDDVKKPFIKRIPYIRYFYKVRNPQLGLDYLSWEATLDDPNSPNFNNTTSRPGEMSQAEAAREIISLYKWWVEVRPARVELEFKEMPMEGSHFLYRLSSKYEKENPEEVIRFKEYCQIKDKQDQAWRKEDDDNLIRLVRIRGHMWT